MADTHGRLQTRVQNGICNAVPGAQSVTMSASAEDWRNTGRSFTAVASIDGKTMDLFVRQSETRSLHLHEIHVYRQVLPHLDVTYPKLYGSFTLEDDDPGWLVLEQVGVRALVAADRTDRHDLMHCLAALHRSGRAASREGVAARLHTFDPDADRCSRWDAVLSRGIEAGTYGLSPVFLRVASGTRAYLSDAPMTLLHGDLDPSNVRIGKDGDVALIDWEKACLGPLAIDLGLLAEHVTDEEEWKAYSLVSHTDTEVQQRDVAVDAHVGWAYRLLDSIITGYVASTERGRGPSEQWRENYYEPALDSVVEIAHRMGW